MSGLVPIEPVAGIFGEGVRAMRVRSGTLHPLNPGDYVGLSPVDSFVYDALYLLWDGSGAQLYRCASDFAGGISIKSDDKGSAFTVTREKFREMVLGLAIAYCHVIDRERFEAWIGEGPATRC